MDSRLSQSPPVRLVPHNFEVDDFFRRYPVVRDLGQGGMGAVRLHTDTRVGRDVAIKTLLPVDDDDADIRARFLREAQIQAQLEHPAILPVYELGRTDDGSEFFSMKRLAGVTLERVIADLAAGDAHTVKTFTRRRLLSAFSQICLALQFAHERGVLHRDLKPSNIMFGEFGEVHVLDWGLAKVMGDAPSPQELTRASLLRRVPAGTPGAVRAPDQTWIDVPLDLTTPHSDDTQYGTVMGTAGYMAPEQAMGAIDLMGPPADVYSLGCILFEILTGEMLHDKDTVPGRMISTIQTECGRPSERRPDDDIPIELDALCAWVTSRALADRARSAREVAEAVDRFLDGDRDLERRRALASEHLSKARAALERDEEASRSEALQQASRAMALDPSAAEPGLLIAELLSWVPSTLPAEAEAEQRSKSLQTRKEAMRMAMTRGILLLVGAPLMLLMGVQSWAWFGATMGAATLLLALSALQLRTRADGGDGARLFILLAAAAGLCLATGVFGPFLVLPLLVLLDVLYFCTFADRQSTQLLIAGGGIALLLVPFALGQLGVIPPAYLFEGGRIVIMPRGLAFPPALTMSVLVTAHVLMLSIPVIVIGKLRAKMSAAEAKLFLHAWHLRRLTGNSSGFE